jgi:hypothetical protein
MTRLRTGLAALALVLALGLPGAAAAAAAPPTASALPVLAYYYIWFTPNSWNRAKLDFPLLGRYSSDDETVMQRHVRWAQASGIDGFLVSWKSKPALDRRLAKLVRVADAARFKLGIVYEGLDFKRNPVPASQVERDLGLIASRYGSDPAFRLLGTKPVVIWAGTWRFSTTEIRIVTAHLRDRLTILASEKNTAGYARVASAVDGDAYYWSSVDPTRYPNYQGKLDAMAAAVHAAHGLWVAPAAPGFDARLIGGKSVVPRRAGDTLRREFRAAVASSPDAVGLISWNEFSENTFVEPSQQGRNDSLKVLASLLHAKAPPVGEFDSNGPPAATGYSNGLPLLGGFAVVLLAGIALVRRRRGRSAPPGDGLPPDHRPAADGPGDR